MKLSKFVTKTMEIAGRPSKLISLEEFLRSVWNTILIHQHGEPSASLFVQIISEAWDGDSGEFDSEWLKIQESADGIEFTTQKQMNDFDYLRGTILYQIADLRRMRNAGYFERGANVLFMGVQSPTGATWYNLSPKSFLECGTRGMKDGAREDIELNDVTWRFFAELLHLGQLYE